MPRKKQNVGENLSTWTIKDVDEETRRKVRVYAAAYNLTAAQALAQLVEKGIRYDRLPRQEQVRPVETDDEVAARLLGDLQRAYNRQKQQQPQPAPNETGE